MPASGTARLLAGGSEGPGALRPMLDTVLDALTHGAADRGGPIPAGGPGAVAHRTHGAARPSLPDHGEGPHPALRTLVTALTAGAADPADPHCAAHLHCPPLAVAAAADLAVSALNPSLDSWDQAPAAAELEALTCRALAELVYPHGPAPDALVTTGGTESNQLALLLAREAAQGAPLRIVCGANAHHSVHRAAWLLGLRPPHTLPTPTGVLDPARVHDALTAQLPRPTLLVATAGTTDTGAIDPLPHLADLCDGHGATLHIDAAYGGPLLFSDTLNKRLDGLDRAHTVALDLHKLGWQPAAAGLLAVPDTTALALLGHRADYLNAHDDTDAGLPDLLGRSLRTTRRADILKIAVTLRALGRHGLGDLVDQVCAHAHALADLVQARPALELYARPTLSTVLFRPKGAGPGAVAALRRGLLHRGTAVLGRAATPEGLWLKATLLNPHIQPGDLRGLLDLVEGTTTP
ncbi:pyridoxal phosphate-dependent decarboxylase family protein [Streptomyces botrytidirepellens]|uniref:Aminotransferase class V-fold PLP-dependent enzyme n=1 Tax=Streptomyces botrytidirepellens TaxID=2486417 RepID=A0A3M8SF94_9ACTN|nr:aminotransferase class V-fold PLP-dependent enzyme [Streptomyces botrytidirepellens]RNF79987.1 aminotransferase class V-fold PLP-dependent enzyme [Streptomyces botrytidirepellens]